MRGDRHMRTARSHNKIRPNGKTIRLPGARGLTQPQRAAGAHAIGNRGVTNEFEATMKVSVQEKIAELERRIVSLEQTRNQEKRARAAASHVRIVNPEPELGRVWKAFDALMKKVFQK